MGKTKSKISLVCDAGPIIHLDELNLLDLLRDFQEIILADTVWEEINRYRPLALNKVDLAPLRRPGKAPCSEPSIGELYDHVSDFIHNT